MGTILAPVAIHNRSRWSQKPQIMGRARPAMIRRGLRFLCCYEGPAPLERVRMIPPSQVSSAARATPSPGGIGMRTTQYHSPTLYDALTDLPLTGELTILTRFYVTGLYYPSFFTKLTNTTGALSEGTTNVPLHFGANNYYNYGEPRFLPYVYRSNASGYKSFYDFADTTKQPTTLRWLDFAVFIDANIGTAPVAYFDGALNQFASGNGSGTGAATDNVGNVQITGYDYEDWSADWLAVFGRKLSMRETLDIFRAPFGELLESPEQERRLYFFVPQSTGGVDATASGVTLTSTASLIAGTAAASSAATGATLSAAASLIAGARTASSTAAGATLAATASLIAGTRTASSTAAGATLAATATLIAGTASGSSAGTASGATLSVTTSLIAGAATAASTAAGATFAATATLQAGTASGTSGGTAAGATLTAAVSLLAGTATGSSSGTASGATLTVAAALVAGTATGSASGTASGATITTIATLIAGTASGTSAGNAPGATLSVSASLISGTRTASSTAAGSTWVASATLIIGGAIAGNPRPATSRIARASGSRRVVTSPGRSRLAKSA